MATGCKFFNSFLALAANFSVPQSFAAAGCNRGCSAIIAMAILLDPPGRMQYGMPKELDYGKRQPLSKCFEGDMTLNPIGLIVKTVPEAQQTADHLETWLKARDVKVQRIHPDAIHSAPSKTACHSPTDRQLACVFVLGGDGTFLSAVRWIGEAPVPILGVKFGEVGFLAEIATEDLFAAAEAVVQKNYAIQQRMRLAISVIRDGIERCAESVLNDVVINTGTLARLALIPTYINDHYLTTFRADGLIVASPTGSTAYSMAAGGPVVHPQVPGIVMTPICPFTLTNRPLVVPDTTRILIKPEEQSTNLILTLDGQAGLDIQHGDTILITKSPHPVHMIQIPDGEYFDVLKAKLSWSGGRA